MEDELEEGRKDAAQTIHPGELLRFVQLSARKHWMLAIFLFLLISVPGVLAARVLPLEYYTRARVLVAPEGIRARVLAGGSGEVAVDLHGALDKTFRDENLRGIVEDMKLAETWHARRPPLLAFKDRLRGGIEKLAPEARTRMLMGTVQKHLTVNPDEYAGVLTIEGTWTDPRTAFDLVQTTLNRFLRERLRAEVQVFEEVLTILEQQRKDAGREVESGLAQVDRASWRPATKAAEVKTEQLTGGAFVETVREVGTPDAGEVARLEEVRRQIRDVQDPWQRRVSDLKLQMSELSIRYGPKHPLVINQEARIREASVPPPGLEELRSEESRLAASVAEASRPKEKMVLKGRPIADSGGSTPVVTTEGKAERIESSATLSTEQSKLMQAINKYNSLVDRIDRTRMELDTASTAFKYRFTVVQKAEVPIAPTKPKMPLMVAIGSIVFGALLALLIGPIRELLSGKLLAPWQAKTLGIPLLGELPLPDSDPR